MLNIQGRVNKQIEFLNLHEKRWKSQKVSNKFLRILVPKDKPGYMVRGHRYYISAQLASKVCFFKCPTRNQSS